MDKTWLMAVIIGIVASCVAFSSEKKKIEPKKYVVQGVIYTSAVEAVVHAARENTPVLLCREIPVEKLVKK